MRRSVTGIATPRTRTHSGITGFPKRFFCFVVILAAIFLVASSLSVGAIASPLPDRVAHQSSSAASSSKKKPIKKRRRTSRQSNQKAPTPDRITEIQSALARGGYYQGDPNGKWDANTIAAMQKFQSANGLDASGKLDALSLQKLGLGSDIAGVSAPKPVTPPGSTGPAASLSRSPATSSPTASSTTSSANNLPSNTSAVASTSASR